MDSKENPQVGQPSLNDQGFRLLMEYANDAIFVLDEYGNFLHANRQAENLLGFSKETLKGKPYHSLLLEEDLEGAAEDIGKVKQGEPVKTLVRMIRADGEIVPVEFSGAFVDLDGRKVLLGIGRDLSERLKAGGDEVRLASIVESSADAIYGTDLEGNITVWNPAAEKLYGYGPQEIIGENVLVLAPADRHGESLRMMEECKEGVAFSHFETVRKNRRMEKIPVSLTLSPLRDKAGRTTGISVIARDLTQEKKSEEAFRKSQEFLNQAQKMEAIGQLAAGVAHDFNNLLSVISGSSEILLSELPMGDPRREEALEIKKTALRGAVLTNQLLVFGRKDVTQPSLLNLDRIIKEMGQMLQRMVGEDMELTLRTDSNINSIKADPVQIQQILMNLCSNSRDAMAQGGKLIIEARNLFFSEPQQKTTGEIPPGSYVLLSVSDSGTGIEPEALTHIFEPFYTTKEIGKGTGLGLANVYSIVKKNGGHVWVYSEIGKGTTFNLIFPRAEGGETGFPAPPSEKFLKGAETLLLVEDEEPLRRILSRQLRQKGYKVLEAGNGEEGLALAAQQPGKIDLLVTDTIMPKMSGKQLADILREACARMKILFMSGYPREVLSQHGVVDPHIHLIQKPFSIESLSLKIREVLEEKTAVR